jgi:alpha-beta hydrolase superfamily lysophospholipase
LFGACAIPRVQEPLGGTEVPRLEADRVVLEDGAVLPLAQWLPARGRPLATIVALHGMNEYRAAFADAGEQLAANDYAVYAYDQRGFGATEQQGLWAGGNVLASDARQVAQLVRARHPGIPLYVLGESMGGTVLLHALTQEPRGWLDGAVLLAPAVWNRRDMPWYQRFGLDFLAHTFRGLKVSRPKSRTPSDNSETLRRLRDDPLVIKKMRVDALSGIADLMDDVTDTRRDVGVPLLILYGQNDEIIPARPFCRWVTSLDDGGPWRLAVYPNGWHLLLRGLDAATAMSDLTAWLKNPGAALPSECEAGKPLDEAACLALVASAALRQSPQCPRDPGLGGSAGAATAARATAG